MLMRKYSNDASVVNLRLFPISLKLKRYTLEIDSGRSFG